MNKLKTYKNFLNENIKHYEKQEVKNNDSFFIDIKKILDSLKLKYHTDEYNEIFNASSLEITNIKWSNPYAIGSHPSNSGDYTNYSKNGSIGSKQLENLSRKIKTLRLDNSKDYFGREFGLYYDGTRNWYVYINKY